MDWNKILMDVLFLVITVVLPVITRYVVVLVNAKIAEKTAKLEDENLKKYIDAATQAVSLAVLTVQQTYTDAMKAAGKFDKEAAKIAKEMALEKAKSIITEESRKYVEMLYGDFESWIDQSIETLVRESKITMPEGIVPNEWDVVPVTE